MTAPECAGCPFPDSVAALELVRLREGIGRLAEEIRFAQMTRLNGTAAGQLSQYELGQVAGLGIAEGRLRALLDDNQGEKC